MVRKNKNFNIIVAGVGGQGLISLAKIIAESAFSSGYDIKTSELHGLSQRGGSVKINIRFGQKIYSPLVLKGKADLIIVLESQETLSNIYFSSAKTNFLINNEQTPTLGKTISEKKLVKEMKIFSNNFELVSAGETCQKELKTSAPTGIFLLSLALQKKLLPLSEKSILKAIKKILPKKYWEVNLKAFELSKK